MKILSVSVAAYNMEKLIRQNLDSFVASRYRDEIEVLVIDDGSKDATPEIAREYEEKYPDTVRLIRQPNAGPGSTVNRGLENARGKYFR
ncbi:MAG: glycosyltransferase family 2 protein, partial [Clostridia bacterium]|nr:glycosyltransferase family 2 protein [Clostridia bacterium]